MAPEHDSPLTQPGPPAYFVGVEVGPALIRAGVFADGLRMLGKTKYSTKLDRGSAAVFQRIARCIAYAADECNLRLDSIQGVAVGLPADVERETGFVRSSDELGWTNLVVQEELEQQLSMPVAIANSSNLAALGIMAQEVKRTPNTFAALFLGPSLGAAVLHRGVWLDLATNPSADDLFESPAQNLLHSFHRPEFRNFRSRDFRKALRKDNRAVHHYLLELVDTAVTLAAQLSDRFHPDLLAIGGGIVDELKEEIVQKMEAKFGPAIPSLGIDQASTPWLASSLGDMAAISGAAFWASQAAARPQVALC